jgi:hypothetical protein
MRQAIPVSCCCRARRRPRGILVDIDQAVGDCSLFVEECVDGGELRVGGFQRVHAVPEQVRALEAARVPGDVLAAVRTPVNSP